MPGMTKPVVAKLIKLFSSVLVGYISLLKQRIIVWDKDFSCFRLFRFQTYKFRVPPIVSL